MDNMGERGLTLQKWRVAQDAKRSTTRLGTWRGFATKYGVNSRHLLCQHLRRTTLASCRFKESLQSTLVKAIHSLVPYQYDWHTSPIQPGKFLPGTIVCPNIPFPVTYAFTGQKRLGLLAIGAVLGRIDGYSTMIG